MLAFLDVFENDYLLSGQSRRRVRPFDQVVRAEIDRAPLSVISRMVRILLCSSASTNGSKGEDVIMMTKTQKHEDGNQTEAAVLKFTPRKSEKRKCSICGRAFSAHGKFERFCSACKEESELYHFYETLPAC